MKLFSSIIGSNQKVIEIFDNMYLKTEDFGVLADGVTDDTAAMQAAVDAMNAQKLPLRVQQGTILIGNSGTVNAPI